MGGFLRRPRRVLEAGHTGRAAEHPAHRDGDGRLGRSIRTALPPLECGPKPGDGPHGNRPGWALPLCLAWLLPSPPPSPPSRRIQGLRPPLPPKATPSSAPGSNRSCASTASSATATSAGGPRAALSRRGWESGGSHGPALVPGDPEASRLIRAIHGGNPELAMPRTIPFPLRRSGSSNRGSGWVPDPRRSRNPAPGNPPGGPSNRSSDPDPSRSRAPDRPFRLRLRDDHALPPARADRRTLLRRLMIDLHGILPTRGRRHLRFRSRHGR